jgi:signal transduction histidine kinase/CheY-like chemotaxis protein
MFEDRGFPNAPSVRSDLTSRVALSVSFFYALIGAALLVGGRRDYPHLHTVLDTGMQMLSGVLAWLLWEIGERLDRAFLKWLAIVFALTSIAELLHVLVTIEWFGALGGIARAAPALRPSTWPVAAYLLPIGCACAIWLLRANRIHLATVTVGLLALNASLLVLFYRLPRYTPPTLLGVTRPTLVFVPLLWVVIGFACWRRQTDDRMLSFLVPTSCLLVVAHTTMLYSRAPHDPAAMIAHLGKVSAYLVLLVLLMKLASADMRERLRAEEALVRLNADLEERVQERTTQLVSANTSLKAEILIRTTAERQADARARRLHLLHQITRAIGERQDLRSIFLVVLQDLEQDLPVDFACICLYDETSQRLDVTAVGRRSHAHAQEMGLGEQSSIAIGENGLSRCLGELIHEPDTAAMVSSFSERLSRGGLRSVVLAPLMVEKATFGVLISARRATNAFSSGECEFMRQLSEHTALASRQAQLYATLSQAYEDLRHSQLAAMQQERLRALGQMASGIAHDINNAIMPAAFYAELIRKDEALSDRGRKQLTTLQQAIADVSATVGRLGEFSRDRGTQLTPASVDLNGLITDVVDLTRARWSDLPQERGIVINVMTDLATNLPTIMGVKSELREALINLVFNAVDAMPRGGSLTLRTVEGSFQAPGLTPLRQVHLEVSDSGMGMDEATRLRCLEPFYTTKGERGTGLGLPMVYGIAQRHNATIEIESAPNEGTTVRLSFAIPTTTIDTPDLSVPEAPAMAPLRFLLVDDDPLVSVALEAWLDSEGHIVTVANGGQEGIDVFRARHAELDIVITDLGMPTIDGRQVARAIKEISAATPVILLTGWGQQLSGTEELPAHVDCVLGKPPAMQQLRLAFEHLMAASRPG